MNPFRRLDRALVLLRVRAGLKQMDLARRAGITPSMISEYEAGKKTPHVETLGKILEVLGLDAHGLASALRTAQREEIESRQRPSPTPGRTSSGTDVITHARFRANDALEEMSEGFDALVRSIEDLVLGLSESTGPSRSGGPPRRAGAPAERLHPLEPEDAD